MIADKVANWRDYGFKGAMAEAFKFIDSITPDIPDGKHQIRGDDIYAVVASYDVSATDTESLEVHRKYIDIQLTLSGCETVVWLPLEGLPVCDPYSEEKDCEFVSRSDMPMSRIELKPGLFAMFLPQDAHYGKLVTHTGSGNVKKVVLKIRHPLLNADCSSKPCE